MIPEDGAGTAPASRMRRMLYGHLLSRALCALAALGVPDVLAERARPVTYLARRVGAREGPLGQLLRALAVFDVVREEAEGTFALTPLGRTLCADTPATALPTAQLVGAEMGQAWDGLLGTMRTGVPAFDTVHGADLFTYLSREPRLRSVFDLSQAADLAIELEEIRRVARFAEYGTIVDVAGGDGALLEAALAESPGARGVLAERPEVLPRARARLDAARLSGRYALRADDIFDTVPAGGDLYLMRQVLHDWGDDRCLRILGACRRAMPAHGTLLIIERVAGEHPATDGARMTALMSLYMLSVLPGQERTRDQFRRLLDDAGLTLRAVHPLSHGGAVLEATPAATRDGTKGTPS